MLCTIRVPVSTVHMRRWSSTELCHYGVDHTLHCRPRAAAQTHRGKHKPATNTKLNCQQQANPMQINLPNTTTFTSDLFCSEDIPSWPPSQCLPHELIQNNLTPKPKHLALPLCIITITFLVIHCCSTGDFISSTPIRNCGFFPQALITKNVK